MATTHACLDVGTGHMVVTGALEIFVDQTSEVTGRAVALVGRIGRTRLENGAFLVFIPNAVCFFIVSPNMIR